MFCIYGVGWMQTRGRRGGAVVVLHVNEAVVMVPPVHTRVIPPGLYPPYVQGEFEEYNRQSYLNDSGQS